MTKFLESSFSSKPASKKYREGYDKIAWPNKCATCNGKGRYDDSGMDVVCGDCPKGRNIARAILNDGKEP